MTHRDLPAHIAASLQQALVLGESLCVLDTRLERVPRQEFGAIALDLGVDPVTAQFAVELYRGLTPVCGWGSNDRALLNALGQAAGCLAPDARAPIVAGAARRIRRLRHEFLSPPTIQTPRRPAPRACPHLCAFLAGASRSLDKAAQHRLRKQVDRHILASVGVERVGARWARRLTLTSLEEFGRALADDVATVILRLEAERDSDVDAFDATRVRRMLQSAARSRASRAREAPTNPTWTEPPAQAGAQR